MIKLLGRGLEFMKKTITPENLKILERQFGKLEDGGEKMLNKMDEVNDKIVESTPVFCGILEVNFLDKNSLKKIIDDYGTPNFHSIAVLKGEYDKGRDRRVFFIQKLNKNQKPINENEVLCIYVNNIDSSIQEWFGNKEMILINK